MCATAINETMDIIDTATEIQDKATAASDAFVN